MPKKKNKEKKKYPLITIFAIPVIAIIFLATSISTFTAYQMTTQSTSDSLEKTMVLTVSEVAKSVSVSLSRITEIASEAAGHEMVYSQDAIPEEQASYLAEKAAQYKVYTADIVGLDGVSRISGKDYSSFDFIKRALSGESVISTPTIDSQSGKLIMYFAVPIYENGNNSQKIIGAFCCTASQLMLSQMIEGISVGENGYAYIIDNEGTFISDPVVSRVENRTNIETLALSDSSLSKIAEIHKKVRNGESGFGEYKYEGEGRFTAFAPIPNSDGWSLLITANKADFEHAARRGLNYLIILEIVYVVIVFFITRPLIKQLTGPISIIEERLHNFAQGDVSTKLPEMSLKSVELNELYNSLSHMIESTDAIISDIDVSLDKLSRCDFDIELDEERYAGDYLSIKNAFLHIRDELSSLMRREAEGSNAIIYNVTQALKSMADGNFNYSISQPELFVNERAVIKVALENIREEISAMLTKIHAASEQVFSGSVQVSDTAQAMAQGSTEQASTIEELTSELAEIDERIKSTASETDRASKLTENVSEIMLNSLHDMNMTREAMDEIAATSKDISKVIKVIDDIAFQTNILALNAAVEAARAGSVGRGFAVVADEVRNLSQKSAEAAKSTTSLIESSIAAVEKGSALVNGTHAAFEDVVSKVNEVVQAVDNASKQASEQAESINLVYNGIKQVSEVVQLNSATSEESAAASEELSSQALELRNLSSQFTIFNKADHEDEYGASQK